MLNWQDESPAVYYNIVILPQILVSYTLLPLVIYINMHSLWIMHKPCFPAQSFQPSQCTSIHTHLIGSALFSLLTISWNTEEVKKGDKNGQYSFLCLFVENIRFLF